MGSFIGLCGDLLAIRVMILYSFAFQTVLVTLGSRRKYIRSRWINSIVWSAYMLADLFATVALGHLSRVVAWQKNKIDPNDVLRALWAPLLLLHLGGPDTITAYQIEDNLLWSRHLLGLGTQLSTAVYVLFRCWNGSWLSILTLVMFIAGIIKYGERIWILTSAITNKEKTKDTIRELDGFIQDAPRGMTSGAKLIWRGYHLFKAFTPCIANYVNTDRVTCLLKDDDTSEGLFKVIEIKLGFMFDALYTKANLFNTRAGCVLRIITFTCTVCTLIGFSLINKDNYCNANVFITYILLVGGVFLEIYAFALRIASDWTIVWMLKHYEKPHVAPFFRILASALQLEHRKRWSNSIGQFDLLIWCKAHPIGSRRSLPIREMYVKYLCQSHVDLKHVKHLKDNILTWTRWIKEEGKIVTPRAGLALQKCGRENWIALTGLVHENQFDKIVVTWCFVTMLLRIHSEKENDIDGDEEAKKRRVVCEIVSNYMMYLLVNYPSMLRGGDNMLDGVDMIDKIRSAFEMFFNPLSDTTGVNLLVHLMFENAFERWVILVNVWMEMLLYVATHCESLDHVGPLRQGGELLTHVWVLLTMYGMTRKASKW